MEKLSEKKKELLKEFVSFTCENCHKKKESNELQIHRINRGYMGGAYCLRNIEVICLDCHKRFHSGEFR
jgi:nitrate/TMAO reductase-like tetraheme cytochrome c subunit